MNLPWVCIGDFNEVTDASEKLGGNPVKTNRITKYKSTMDECQLIDVGFSGQRFTWTNRRRTNTIFERLDRAWVNQAWLDSHPNTHLRHLIRLSSDHCPILLETKIAYSPSPKRFKFESLWLSEPTFQAATTNSWMATTSPFPKKIISLSHDLTLWAKESVGNLFRNKKRLLARLEGVQRELCLHPNSTFLFYLNNTLSSDLSKLLDHEQLYWRDRARSSWLVDGDRNTTFFHHSVTQRRNYNRIVAIEDDVGNTLDNPNDIINHITSFFKNLFTTDHPSSSSNSLDYTPLIQCSSIPLEQEIKDALFSLGSNKAPGPDGFHASFFKHCWGTIKGDLIPFIQNIFITRKLPPSINGTIVSLIPKNPNPTTIRQFRPISLCNTSYKIITKILVGRLKPLMHTLISPNQGSSIPGRGTDSNYIIASEILHSMKTYKGNMGWFAIKLDLEKAFDRLEWSFIRDCLIRCKIDQNTISLIMDCLSSSTTQILINGSPTPSFTPSRGIRQGDPLSPYLFIICMEALSASIHQACETSEWTPFPLGKGGTSFSHLLFADDILLFGRTDEKTLCALQHTLHCFCLDSGQKINFSKSKLLLSRSTSPSAITMFETSFGLKRSTSLGTYLGFPLADKKPSKSEIQPIIDKIQSKLASWKTKFLSRAGRLCLIHSTLNAIPGHYMQCLLLPTSFHNSLDRVVNNFLWSGGTKHNKLHLINWHQVTQPKEMGGLGIRRASTLNKAYSAKLCWKTKFLPQSIASKALHSKYIINRRSPTPFNKGSHLWSNIGKGWDTVNPSLEWSMGNGHSIKLWSDNWTTLGPLRTLITGPLNFGNDNALVSSIINGSKWDLSTIEFDLPIHIVTTIHALPLPSSARGDLPSSSLATNLSFSVGRAYSYITSNLTHAPLNQTHAYKWLWSLPTQPRIKIFIWLAWWDRLPHKSTLLSRSILSNAVCESCSASVENTIHILRDCPSATKAWNFHTLPANFFELNLQEWLLTNCSSSNKTWSTLFSFTTWRLWIRRNNRVFNSTIEQISPHWSNSVTRESSTWSSAQLPSKTTLLTTTDIGSPHQNPNIWTPPPMHWLKINVDASHCPSTLTTGIGGVIRDYSGTWIFGWSRKCSALTPHAGELLAIKEGLLHAQHTHGRYLLISDCQLAVNTITTNDPICNINANLVLECRALLAGLPDLEIRFEKRSANAVADAIARFGMKNDNLCNGTRTWNVIPRFAFELCNADISACNVLSPNPPP